ncbi:MAG: hypothetical protein ACLT1J_00930 [Mediterraneibacter gnavus]
MREREHSKKSPDNFGTLFLQTAFRRLQVLHVRTTIQQKKRGGGKKKMMDYVSNKNGTIAREKGADHASVLLAYDMLLTAMRNNKKKSGKGKEKHA